MDAQFNISASYFSFSFSSCSFYQPFVCVFCTQTVEILLAASKLVSKMDFMQNLLCHLISNGMATPINDLHIVLWYWYHVRRNWSLILQGTLHTSRCTNVFADKTAQSQPTTQTKPLCVLKFRFWREKKKQCFRFSIADENWVSNKNVSENYISNHIKKYSLYAWCECIIKLRVSTLTLSKRPPKFKESLQILFCHSHVFGYKVKNQSNSSSYTNAVRVVCR